MFTISSSGSCARNVTFIFIGSFSFSKYKWLNESQKDNLNSKTTFSSNERSKLPDEEDIASNAPFQTCCIIYLDYTFHTFHLALRKHSARCNLKYTYILSKSRLLLLFNLDFYVYNSC